MERDAGWRPAFRLGGCDRCGHASGRSTLIEWSVPIDLNLCPTCQQLCWIELWVNRRPALLEVYRQALLDAVARDVIEPGGRAAGSQGNP
jgi:transcription elongation factor Elf1